MSFEFVPRTIFTKEHDEYRLKVRQFISDNVAPHLMRWAEAGRVDVEIFHKAMENGIYLMGIPKEYGGSGLTDFRYNVIVTEELERQDCASVFFTLGNDICLPYYTEITTLEQRKRWLPYIIQNKSIISVCMSEVFAGSDLQNIKAEAIYNNDTGKWVLNGSKMWISSGAIADLHIVVARTKFDCPTYKGLTLFVVKNTDKGFRCAKVLDKIGKHAQDTAALTFRNVELFPDRIIGIENGAFGLLMRNLAQERLGIAVSAVAGAKRVIDLTISYTQKRNVFQRTVGDFQHIAFSIARLVSEWNILQCAVDKAIELHCTHTCTAEFTSILKLQCTEFHHKTADICLQYFGGVGFLTSNPVARHFVDSRVPRIYGGANEIMLENISRKIGYKRAPSHHEITILKEQLHKLQSQIDNTTTTSSSTQQDAKL